MKSGKFLVFGIVAILLFFVAGFFYAKTNNLEREKESLIISIHKEINRNRELKTEYYESVDLDKIYSYATQKLKMVPPSSYVVTELDNGK